MSKLLKYHLKLFNFNSPFALAVIAGLVIGLGDLVATFSDLIWLFGDMHIETHAHHWPVLIGLTIAFIIMVLSFYWLYKGTTKYMRKMKKKAKFHAKYDEAHTPNHCAVKKNKYKPLDNSLHNWQFYD